MCGEPGEAILAQVWLNDTGKASKNRFPCCVSLSKSSCLHITCLSTLNGHVLRADIDSGTLS